MRLGSGRISAAVLESAHTPMAVLNVALLGTFEARLGSGAALTFPRKKSEALLAYLALHPGQTQARDKLAALLWGDASDERVRHSLRQARMTLRRGLPGQAPLVWSRKAARSGSIPGAVEVDVALFERLPRTVVPRRAATKMFAELGMPWWRAN